MRYEYGPTEERQSLIHRRHFIIAALVTVCVSTVVSARATVSLVGSDDVTLSAPVGRDESLTTQQVEDMVRRAVDLVGGMASVVADTARLVVIKPNISIPMPRGSGVITDARLIRAVAVLVHEAAPQAAIRIGEAPGGWIAPATADSVGYEASFFFKWLSDLISDGFEEGGYRDVAVELREQGIDIACIDMNWGRNDTLSFVDGGLADDEYIIAEPIMEADVWINCPVMKTHGPKITVAMKNRYGILPGSVYGVSKQRGTQTHAGMPHAPSEAEELMVDLWRLAPEDLVVVDGIVGHEEGGLQSGAPIRTNQILAGRNPVAVDLTAAYLMGFNPDDMEFALLADKVGLGPRRFDEVEVTGADLEEHRQRFKKAGGAYEGWFYGGEWAQVANYGMGPRYWTLMGPYADDHMLGAEELAALEPVPGEGDWSEPIWFDHDRINLEEPLGNLSKAVVYGATWFSVVDAGPVRFLAGSDEGLTVWIDGKQIYTHQGRRSHKLGDDRMEGFLSAGEHLLVVRAVQGRGRFVFSFNICEPMDDMLYAGNTLPGLRYYPDRRRPDDF